MPNERTDALLEEICDLHREHLDLYREALANQTSSIAQQRAAIAYTRRFGRLAMFVVLPALAFVLGLLIWMLRTYA